jgi:hypothetical protein
MTTRTEIFVGGCDPRRNVVSRLAEKGGGEKAAH